MKELISELLSPLSAEPIRGGGFQPPGQFQNIKCLAFDLYGTLLISAAGGDSLDRESILRDLLPLESLPETPLVPILHDLVKEDHLKSREQGIEFPEVDILEIWDRFFSRLSLPNPDLPRFALHYELLTNPVWPMPGFDALPSHLPLALISNAQFYTPLLMEELLPLEFEEDLTFFSYQHRQAKPGTFLFEKLAESLKARNISPSETLYIGNDHKKDVIPAQQTGFPSVLFAGDTRSLRTSPDLPAPDAIITHLSQINDLLPKS